MTEKLNVLHRYSEHKALITLGHSYSIPSRVTKKHLLDLIAGYDDDEVLNLAQIETPAGMPRPVIVRPADLSADRPEWLCLCANEEDPV